MALFDGYSTRIDVDPHEAARRRRLQCIESDDLTLTLDLDTSESVKLCEKRLTELGSAWRWETRRDLVRYRLDTRSQNDGRHTYVALDRPMPPAERVAAQMWLGSDPEREMLNLLRLQLSPGQPAIVMFETASEAKRVRQWMQQRRALWAAAHAGGEKAAEALERSLGARRERA